MLVEEHPRLDEVHVHLLNEERVPFGLAVDHPR